MPEETHLDKLENGLNVLVEIKSGLFKGNYLSRIFKLVKDKEIFIELPENKDGKLVEFWPKIKVYISFFRENEPGAIYIFEKQIDRIEHTPKKCFVVSYPSAIERIQRRNYVRVDVRLPFFYQKYRDDGSKMPLKKGLILDISGGGVLLRTPEYIEKDTFLQTKFKLGEEDFDVRSKVVRVIEKHRGRKSMYKYGIIFDNISEMVRRKIIGFVFDVERNNIRKQKDEI
jgi:c-di-GMP-binding flagellar brake protein YcgR